MTDPDVLPIDAARTARGISLLGVVPLDGGVVPEWEPAEPRLGVRLVGHQDVAAIICTAPPAGADSDPLHVTARHWEVHRALLQGDVVPAPPGVVFPGEEEVQRFLEEAYPTLRNALARVAGRWEFRLHVDVVDQAFPHAKALDLATHIYAELRRLAGAAIPAPATETRVLSAAFLVPRAASAAFRDRVEHLSQLNPALELDLTGPWPAYDFVQMMG
ncbi:MAG TPA: GvpL/GvpF family gas vesicle protein [Longimicrobium sp.]|jgi:hypothetical protein